MKKVMESKRKINVNSSMELLENDIWNVDDQIAIKTYIESESAKLTPERKLRNELLAIKYQMENYITSNNVDKEMHIFDFVKLYLKLFKITQKDLAKVLEMRDSNLYKYLKGQRRLNTDLVFKLSSFSHTQPEIWFYIQTKNELLQITKEKKNLQKYQKYDYENILNIGD